MGVPNGRPLYRTAGSIGSKITRTVQHNAVTYSERVVDNVDGYTAVFDLRPVYYCSVGLHSSASVFHVKRKYTQCSVPYCMNHTARFNLNVADWTLLLVGIHLNPGPVSGAEIVAGPTSQSQIVDFRHRRRNDDNLHPRPSTASSTGHPRGSAVRRLSHAAGDQCLPTTAR